MATGKICSSVAFEGRMIVPLRFWMSSVEFPLLLPRRPGKTQILSEEGGTEILSNRAHYSAVNIYETFQNNDHRCATWDQPTTTIPFGWIETGATMLQVTKPQFESPGVWWNKTTLVWASHLARPPVNRGRIMVLSSAALNTVGALILESTILYSSKSTSS